VTERDFRQAIIDEEHLRLVALGFKVSAGIALFRVLGGLAYIGLAILSVEIGKAYSNPAPPSMVAVLLAVGGILLVPGVVAMVLDWVTAISVSQRRSRGFCQFVAALSCLSIPYGTALGVLSLMVLHRPSVKMRFGLSPVQPAAPVNPDTFESWR
jgi:hypothetical protein